MTQGSPSKSLGLPAESALSEKAWLYEKLGQAAVANLERNNILASFLPGHQEAFDRVLALIPGGASIGLGDSMTVEQLGLLAHLRQASRHGRYRLFDRHRHGIAPDGLEDDGDNKYRALTADVFLTGANAITLDGKLVYVDAVGTRVGPVLFGPKKVIVVAGANKIVKDTEEGLRRIREVAAPMNARRHHADDLPCAQTGRCVDCRNPRRICNYTVIIDRVRGMDRGRLNVFIVGEELGL